MPHEFNHAASQRALRLGVDRPGAGCLTPARLRAKRMVGGAKADGIRMLPQVVGVIVPLPRNKGIMGKDIALQLPEHPPGEARPVAANGVPPVSKKAGSRVAISRGVVRKVRDAPITVEEAKFIGASLVVVVEQPQTGGSATRVNSNRLGRGSDCRTAVLLLDHRLARSDFRLLLGPANLLRLHLRRTIGLQPNDGSGDGAFFILPWVAGFTQPWLNTAASSHH